MANLCSYCLSGLEILLLQDTNCWGSVYTTHFAAPHLRDSKGKIIVLSDSAAWLNQPRMSFYNVSDDELELGFTVFTSFPSTN